MAGTKAGGIKARNTNYERYGMDFYRNMGKLGGGRSSTGGFASMKVGRDGLTGPERAKIQGVRGGRISRRGPSKNI